MANLLRYLVVAFFVIFYLWFLYFINNYQNPNEAYRLFFIDKSVPFYIKNTTRDYEWGKTINAKKPQLYFSNSWFFSRSNGYVGSPETLTDNNTENFPLFVRFDRSHKGDTCFVAEGKGVKSGDKDDGFLLGSSINGIGMSSVTQKEGRFYFNFLDLEVSASQEAEVIITSNRQIVVTALAFFDRNCGN